MSQKPLLGAAIARLYDVTPRTVRGWALAGCPHTPGPRGYTYELDKVIQWRRGQDLEETQHGTTPDEAQERARKLRAEASLAELRLLERKGDLVPARQIEREWDQALGVFRSRVLALRGRWAPRLLGLASMAEAAAAMDAMGDNILSALRETADELEGGDLPDVDEEDVA